MYDDLKAAVREAKERLERAQLEAAACYNSLTVLRGVEAQAMTDWMNAKNTLTKAVLSDC